MSAEWEIQRNAAKPRRKLGDYVTPEDAVRQQSMDEYEGWSRATVMVPQRALWQAKLSGRAKCPSKVHHAPPFQEPEFMFNIKRKGVECQGI
jgi:hypothetical protein